MSDAFPIQTNFTSGEVSPVMKGRVDTERYFNAAESIKNFHVLPQGGLLRRNGTEFINEVKDSSKLTILKRFVFSTIQSYMLEFGENYIRIYRDGGVVEDGGSPVEVTTTYAEDELRDLKFAQSADFLYIVHKDHPPAHLTRSSDIAWTLSDFDYVDGPYLTEDTSDTELRLESISDTATITSTASDFVVGDVGKYVEYTYQGNTSVGEITAYVSATEVTIKPKDNAIDFTSIDPASVLSYAASDANFPDRIRSTLAIWSTKSENAYIKVGGTWYLTSGNIAANETIVVIGGPDYSVDIIEVASTPTMVTTTGTIIFSNRVITATVTSSKNVFDASRDVGRHLRMNFLGDQVWGELSAVASATSATILLGRAVPPDPTRPDQYLADAKTVKWRFGAWYVANYPQVINFHQGRLNFYSTPLQPQTHWTSKSADYPVFSPTDNNSEVQDDSAITATFDSGKINSILWAVTGPVLLVGTVGSEWQIKAESFNEALTPDNYNAREQTSWGSENISPERIGQSLIYVQYGGRTVRELVYSFEIDSFVANNLNIVSGHIFRDRGKVIDIAYQRNPFTRIWFATTNGELVCATFEKEQQVVAWNHHIIGGAFSTGNSVVEAVEALPGSGADDEVYVIVKRTVDGNTVRYVERLSADFWPSSTEDKDSMMFMDSHLTYSGSPVSSVTGLDHLEGETVQIVADGSVRPPKVVASGSVTIDGTAASKAVVGLGYSSTVKTLPIEAGSRSGTAQGKVKRINALVVRVNSSIGFYHGTDPGNLTLLSFRSTDDPMDSSPPLFSGDKKITLDSSYDRLSSYYVEQSQPYPLTILSLMPQLTTYQ